MIGKIARIVVVLLVAVGVPYLWKHKQVTRTLKAALPDQLSGRQDSVFDYSPSSAQDLAAARVGAAGNARTPRIDSLEEVLRFDVTHQWVTHHWPRVSTVRTEPGLVGLRVPFMSGTELSDVTGSLTYYFDEKGKTRRIALHGQTGDPSKLLAIAGQRFELRSEPNLRAGLHIARWNGKPTSALWLSYPDVVRADRPHSRYQVRMEVNQRSPGFQLSSELTALLLQEGRYDRR